MRNQICREYFSLDIRWTGADAVSFSLAIAAWVSLSLLTSSVIAKDDVALIRKVSGKVTDATLLSKLPAGNVVADEANWNSLWTAWRADEAVLKVDFQNQIVLVATAIGPNIVLTSSLNLTPSGDLRYEVASTKMAGPGFGYALLVVPRNRIVSVNGQLLPAAPALPIAKPAALPPMTTPIAGNNKLANELEESIRVEIQGRVRTGVMSRARSTGTMVVANGIVWELDLRNDAQLVNAARKLGTDVGTIKGSLSKIENPDRSFRWVVDVESISPSASSRPNDKDQPALPNGLEATATTEIANTRSSSSPPPTAQQNMPTETIPVKVGSAIPVTEQTGFESIIVSATGGRSNLERKQTVAADGSVTLEVPKTGYSESFSLSAVSLTELHQFVANTDWRTVQPRTGTIGKNVTTFSISVVTKSGTKRFFIDGGSVKSQPVIARLFSLMRKPKSGE